MFRSKVLSAIIWEIRWNRAFLMAPFANSRYERFAQTFDGWPVPLMAIECSELIRSVGLPVFFDLPAEVCSDEFGSCCLTVFEGFVPLS